MQFKDVICRSIAEIKETIRQHVADDWEHHGMSTGYDKIGPLFVLRFNKPIIVEAADFDLSNGGSSTSSK